MNEFVLNEVVKRRAELVDNIERTHEAATRPAEERRDERCLGGEGMSHAATLARKNGAAKANSGRRA